MTFTLDHLAVTGATLAEAASHIETALGVPLQAGGKHDRFGTHNRLLGLEQGLYLEAIAADPDAPDPGRPRWFDIDRFQGPPRLTNWICRTADLAAALVAYPGAGQIHDLERGSYRWRMAVPPDGILPMQGLFPALIQWHGSAHPATALTQQGVRLVRLEVALPDPAPLFEALALALQDGRVQIVPGPRPALRASFDTPHGRRVLE